MTRRIIAIGDIHGCNRTFEKLLALINPSMDDSIILLGDYIDRGPSPKEVIDRIIRLNEEGFQVVPLMGNHESMLLNSVNNPRGYASWMYNGGAETLLSFGIDTASEIPGKYLNFFRNLCYCKTIENYHFVHAGFNEESTDPFSDTISMLWSRKVKYTSPWANDKVIIHGHTPTALETLKETIDRNLPVINLDTGCVYASRDGMGYLSAIVLPERTLLYVKNCDSFD